MKKSIKIGLIVGIVLIVVITSFLAYSFYIKIEVHPDNDLKLTEDKLITNQTLINMIVNDLKSPLGNNLTKSVIDGDNPEIMDDPWKYAYYVCTNNEHSGWIYYSCGECETPAGLYGPYEWCYT